ncbi:hypothetical protein VE01_00812 [Pseudogymnoascus verrucosus]|uniref:VPS9 domain-containing protein n=1 Tax=Pseudogymnoascus verrucosus TaxID=342668 RepID=A0A2P2SWG5_9PEZI|nr:uncharacterized protein VE01_00812 [Pseudogymnoascus verrucosus]OBU01134.1 hypothetical protein VE01_00812 [Pseudogymnoascus verrucosus]
MAPKVSKTPNNGDEPRRRPLQAYNSFPRIDSDPKDSSRRTRASTSDGSSPNVNYENDAEIANQPSESDSTPSTIDRARKGSDKSGELDTSELPSDFDALPVELISLTDTFVDSLSAKVHATPPTVDRLSMLLQDFYVLAATHINTHISILSSRQNRRASPSASISSKSSAASRIRARAVSIGTKDRPKALESQDSEQQLLTVEEIAEKKKARKVLEHKRLALEEAVERRVCDKVYTKIWRHRSTQDEAQDEKLRSKTAALAVVGIGLTDLGIDLGEETSSNDASKEEEVKSWLEGARQELLLMNSDTSPLGKLQHLKAAHKCIVETLSHFHPSSSADEIMPMLIYTLITSPTEDLNVISNLYFIQRFRCESKIDGEAAYCLTNLEAAITFLETVDLTQLRADEAPSGPPKSSSRPTTPRFESPHPISASTPAQGVSTPSLSPAVISPPSTDSRSGTVRKSDLSPSILRPPPTNRRLSELFHPAQALGAAAQDAVLNTADQGIKTIGNSLGESYNFLLGKLKERQEAKHEVVVPKTLDEARKLVEPNQPDDDDVDAASASLNSMAPPAPKSDDKAIHLIAGRPPRDRSIDSASSSASTKRATPGVTAPSLQVADGIRMLSNTFNPMSKFAGGIGMMRGFGRAAPPAAGKEEMDGAVEELTTAFPDLAAVLPPGKAGVKVDPPIQRFMEVRDPGELRLNEVVELLRDYRRLAGSLKELGAL